MKDQDYYSILGVPRDEDTAGIKAAYRELAFKYHPDRNEGNPGAAVKMKALNEAYAVLSDEKKRRDYDSLHRQYGSSGAYTHFRKAYSEQDIFSGTDIHKVFQDLAASFGYRDFDEIFKELHGKDKTFEYKGRNVHFKGFFFAGTFTPGNFLGKAARTLLQTLAGHGIAQKPRDLHDTIRIAPDLAETGGPYAYYHKWRSKKLIVKIPPGIRHGQQIRLTGMGEKGSHGAGDLFLKVETKSSLVNSLRKFLPF